MCIIQNGCDINKICIGEEKKMYLPPRLKKFNLDLSKFILSSYEILDWYFCFCCLTILFLNLLFFFS